MNKTDLINEVAAKAGLSKVDAKKAVDAVFGTFAVQEKPAREGINPRTKEKIQIEAKKVVKFKAADNLGK